MRSYADPDKQIVVQLYVQNMKESTEFYRSLGFEVVEEEGNFAQLKWGDAFLFLEEASEAPSPSINPVGNIRILVPNVDHYWGLSQKLGIPATRPIEDRYYGLRDFTIAGPDGMGLRFATRISELEAKKEMKPHANSPPLRILLRVRDGEKEMFRSASAGADKTNVKVEKGGAYEE